MASNPFAALNRACVNTFGKAVSYKPSTGAAFPVKLIIERRSSEEQYNASIYLVASGNLADFAAPPAQGDELVVDGATHKVFEVGTDAAGMVRMLARQA